MRNDKWTAATGAPSGRRLIAVGALSADHVQTDGIWVVDSWVSQVAGRVALEW